MDDQYPSPRRTRYGKTLLLLMLGALVGLALTLVSAWYALMIFVGSGMTASASGGPVSVSLLLIWTPSLVYWAVYLFLALRKRG